MTGARPQNRNKGRDADRWRSWWRENEKTFSFEDAALARDRAEAEAKAKAERKRKAREERKNKKKGGGKKKPNKPGKKKDPAID